jgi:DegV family protein with EDD domain
LSAARPAVLIVDDHDERRRALAHGLAARGYEVVPTISAAEGLLFAQSLGPSVIVGAAHLEGLHDGSILRRFAVADPAQIRRILVLLEDHKVGDDELPDEALVLPSAGLDVVELERRIFLVLIGRELELETDLELRYLVGDAAYLPVLDLARSLARARLTARVAVAGGWLAFDRGTLIGARSGRTEGSKAFCRLTRNANGPFRIFLEPPTELPNISGELDGLILMALQESSCEFPDPRTRVRLVAPRDLPSGELTPNERQLAQVIDLCPTVGDVLDAIGAAPDFLVLQALNKMASRGALKLERPKVAVKIVTDSTCDLPAVLARAHDILVVPLSIFFGKEQYRDGIDIQARDFYQLLASNPAHPRTQPPPEEVFYENFRELIVEQDLLAVHISGKLSLTAENARKAALRGIKTFDHLPAKRQSPALEVVDSQTVSLGVGLMALFAARMAARGERVFTIAERLRRMTGRVHILFGVDTLEFLERGGRIGKAQALVGRLLGIKPILGVVGGEVVPVDRVRGGRKVQPRIVQLVAQRIDPKLPIVAAVGHAQAPVWGDRLRRLLESTFKIREMIVSDIGPVVGTHAGPGCVGTVFFQPTDEEWPLIAPLE